MKEVRQHFAYDENGNLVEIHSTHKGDGHVYYCPYCKQELTPKRGEHNEWHFAHKPDSKVECSYDHYLHSLAIEKIYQWYINAPRVDLMLRNKHKCDVLDCKWRIDDCQKDGLTEPINLKDIYETAEIEKEFETASGKFRADIMLSSSKYPKDPIFLEIYVTHACTPEKINSGLRIIEIKIDSEDDIERFTRRHVLKEYIDNSGKVDIEDDRLFLCNREMLSFYGFKVKDTLIPNMERRFEKFILYPSKKIFITSCTCRDYNIGRKGILEITASIDRYSSFFISFLESCLAKVYQMGYVTKACKLCKYKGEEIWMNHAEVCHLSNKFGTAVLCKDNDELNCQYFRLHKDNYAYNLEYFDKPSNKCRYEIWKKE